MMFQPNPVAMRESRAMWRGARSFLLLGLYTGALALVAYLAYSSEVRHATAVASFNGEEIQVQSARVGRSLFTALSYVQVVAWLLISPALTATSISSERERGLLESLLMSYLKPRQIVAGKFSVCASFVALLIVATLPVLAICFLLGGVSPGEFTGAFLIQATTAFCAMSLGVWCSAGLRLSTHALGATFGGLVFWTLASMFLMTAGDHGANADWPEHAARTLALCNPLFGMWVLLEPNDRSFTPLLLEPQWRWTLCVGAQVLAGAFFLHGAARRLAAPLEAEEEPRRKSKNAAAAGASTGASTWGELEERGAAPIEKRGHFDVPILKYLVAGGPLLRHHLRATWRWKIPRGRARRWWAAAAVFFALCNLYAIGWASLNTRDAHGLFMMAVIMVGLAIPIFVVASSGLSIARDKELGTWNGLRLSAIRSGEITRAKIAAPIIAALGYSLVLLPTALFVFGVDYLHLQSQSGDSYRWRTYQALALMLPYYTLGLVQLGAWGLICSLRARRSSLALVAAFAGGLIFLVGIPVVIELTLGSISYSSRRELYGLLAIPHTSYAIISAAELPDRYSYNASHGPLLVVALFSQSAIAFGLYSYARALIARREK